MDAPARILVADDDPTNRVILVRSLERAGYEVCTATDGIEAVEAANRFLPDLMLLDVMMPGRSGVEVCSILKEREPTASIPVIFVTAACETTQILEGFNAGGCDYITRPFTVDELLARVSVHVRLKQAEEELRQKNEQLHDLARQLRDINSKLALANRQDSLTKLLNRSSWDEAIAAEHARFMRYKTHYSVLMVDLDHFKVFNDTRGHQAGDDCLRRVAKAMVTACRQGDHVGRYGGEEFVVLAPETSAEAGVQLAERIRGAIWSLGIVYPASGTADRVTASLGVATSAPGDWEDVLKRADAAMYVAKRAGRNMVYNDQRRSSPHAGQAARRVQSSEEGLPEGAFDGRLSVLVVDDEAANRALCRACLERAGYRVGEAVDGQAALSKVGEEPPDVVLMDVMMPNMDGLECTRRLKADPDTRDIPIIMVSALAGKKDILAGLEAGADEYLTKPIRTTELVLRVATMARLRRDRADLLRSYEVRGEHVRILSRLVEFCQAISTSRKLDDILDHTIDAVADITRARRISIMHPDESGQSLVISRSVGVDAELAATTRVPIGEPIAGQVFATGQPVVFNSDAEAAAGSPAYDSRFFASIPLISAPLETGGQVTGVLNVTDRVGGEPFEPHELEFVELIGKVAATASQELAMRRAHEQACDSIMVGLAALAECRDNDTGRHLDRVTRYCHMLAEELHRQPRFRVEIDEAFLFNLERAVPLHDIGKVAIPDAILLHPGKLSEEQMEIMRTHAEIGAAAIRKLLKRTPQVSFLAMAAEIANYHHEWYDGSGYPTGLGGEQIPLSARVAAVADVYDALTTKRVYKDAIGHDRALAIVVGGSGAQFDPAIVDALVERERDFAELAEALADDLPQEAAAPTEPEPSIS